MSDHPPPSFEKGDPGEVVNARPKGFERLVTDLILEWASFDTGLLLFISDAFEMPFRNARVLVGNMDIKGRIGKIKTLASYMGLDDLKALLAQWERQYEAAVFPRNVIAHQYYFGHLVDRPDCLVFGPSRAERGPPTQASILVLQRPYIEHSTRWANMHAKHCDDLMEALREAPLSELEKALAPILR